MSTVLTVKAGQFVPDSGIYVNQQSLKAVALVKGKKAPPTLGPDQCWIQVIDASCAPFGLQHGGHSCTPGQEVPDSGIYRSFATKQQVTLIKGETAPPSKTTGDVWVQIADPNPNN